MAKRKAVDPITKYAELKLNGASYSLCFDFNAIAEAEARTGLNLLQSLSFQGLDAQKYRALLYAAMLKAHPDTTIEKAGSLICLPDLDAITNALLEAWLNSKQVSKENPTMPVAIPAS